MKDVISENDTLTDQAKGGVSRSVFPDSSESDAIDHEFNYALKPKAKVPLHGPNIVFEVSDKVFVSASANVLVSASANVVESAQK